MVYGYVYCKMVTQTKQLQRAKTAVRESKTLDFKRELDVSSAGAWCELIKDMIAFANSGGGIILLGVEDDGSNSATDPSSFGKAGWVVYAKSFSRRLAKR